MTLLVTPRVESIFGKAQFSKERTNIPNDHKALAHEVDRLKTIAEFMGIDFEETKYTYTVTKKPEGLSVYAASVMGMGGEPVLCWGDARVPLKALKPEYTLEQEDKRLFLELTSDEMSLQVPVVLSKKLTNKPDRSELRKAMKAGTLANYLATTFVKGKSLSELQPGVYTVVGYVVSYPRGEAKVDLKVLEAGWVSANTYLKKKILGGEPVITHEQPASMEVGIVTRYTDSNKPIVPVTLETQEDKEIPVFDFTFDEEEEVKGQFNQEEQNELDEVLRF